MGPARDGGISEPSSEYFLVGIHRSRAWRREFREYPDVYSVGFDPDTGFPGADSWKVDGSKQKGRGNASHGLALRFFLRQWLTPASTSMDVAVINFVRISRGVTKTPVSQVLTAGKLKAPNKKAAGTRPTAS